MAERRWQRWLRLAWTYGLLGALSVGLALALTLRVRGGQADGIEAVWLWVAMTGLLFSLWNAAVAWRDLCAAQWAHEDEALAGMFLRRELLRLTTLACFALAGLLVLFFPPGMFREVVIWLLIAGNAAVAVNSVLDRIDRKRVLRG